MTASTADEPAGAAADAPTGGQSSLAERGVLGASAPPGSPTVPGTGMQVLPDETERDRGRLDIALSVVRKIAEHAADLTEGTTTVRRRVAGLGLGQSRSTARVSGYGDQVDVRLELPLAYPTPITTTVEAVRGNVRERVQALTGYHVRSVDVTVSALTSASPGPARTGRTE